MSDSRFQTDEYQGLAAAEASAPAPAFGSTPGAYENAAEQYAEFHATIWRNLQYLRGTLHGMIAGLQTAIENGGEADDWVAMRMRGCPETTSTPEPRGSGATSWRGASRRAAGRARRPA